MTGLIMNHDYAPTKKLETFGEKIGISDWHDNYVL